MTDTAPQANARMSNQEIDDVVLYFETNNLGPYHGQVSAAIRQLRADLDEMAQREIGRVSNEAAMDVAKGVAELSWHQAQEQIDKLESGYREIQAMLKRRKQPQSIDIDADNLLLVSISSLVDDVLEVKDDVS